ncbi:MAG: hypothetical protein AAGB51_13725 [Planctomycetota bacterium]
MQQQRPHVFILFLLTCAIVLPGCIGSRIHNPDPDQYIRSLKGEPGVSIDLAIIEFDDFGAFWDESQLFAAEELIQRRNAEVPGAVAVAVYVHGWQNDADPDRKNGDLNRFQEELHDLAIGFARARERGDEVPDHLVGVYMGWRGASTRVLPFNLMTFWNRRRAAERVASFDMRESFYRLTESANSKRESSIVITGHSMGGLIVGKTIHPSVSTILLNAWSEGRPETPIDVGLVLLENPALEAYSVHQVIKQLKKAGASTELRSTDGSVEPGGPLVVAITSEADSVTKIAYPAGLIFDNMFRDTRDDHAEGEPSQWHLITRAVGHVDYLASHDAYIDEAGELRIEPIEGAYNDTPYWVIRCDSEISGSHGDIWNDRFRGLIGMLVGTHQVFDPNKQLWLVIDPPYESGQ